MVINAAAQLGDEQTKGFRSSWRLPPNKLSLGSHDVHVWLVALDLHSSQVENLKQSLSEDERARAERYYSQKDGEHFIVSRGLLRIILGRYLSIKPDQLRFCYSQNGKPVLDHDLGRQTFNFNTSHSETLALYAVTRGRDIGVDIQHIQEHLPYMEIAERFFSPGEVSTLRSLPTTLQKEAFFKCWTRKEACIKARGEELFAIGQFEVSVDPGEPTELLRVQGDSDEASLWCLQDLELDPDFMAALAVKGHNWHITCYQWARLK